MSLPCPVSPTPTGANYPACRGVFPGLFGGDPDVSKNSNKIKAGSEHNSPLSDAPGHIGPCTLWSDNRGGGETSPRPARCAAPVLLRGLRIALRSAVASHHRPGPPDPQGTGELGPSQRSHSPLPQAGSCTRGGRLVPCWRPVSCPVLAGLISPHVSPLVSCPSICVQRGAPKNGASLGLISSWYFRATVCGY